MPTVIRGSDNIDTSNVATQTELDKRTLTLGTVQTAVVQVWTLLAYLAGLRELLLCLMW